MYYIPLLTYRQPVVYNAETVLGTIFAVDGAPIGTATFDASGSMRMVSSTLHPGKTLCNDPPTQARGRRRQANVSRFLDLEAEVDEDEEDEQEGDEDGVLAGE